MTRKVYKTAQGRTVDLGALMLQNENIRAVGNMKVNARGDLIDGWNRPIDKRTQQVQKQYDKQVSNVVDKPAISSQELIRTPAPVPRELHTKTETTKSNKTTKSVKNDQPIKENDPTINNINSSIADTQVQSESTGLAAAIARARQIKQAPIKSLQQQAKDQPGVTRI